MGDDVGKGLGNWSSLIGIITAISGNVLIALALNVQRYSHIQLNRKRVENRERARQALKRAQGRGQNGYGSLDGNRDSYFGVDGGDDAEDADEAQPLRQSFQYSQTDDSKDDEVSSNYLKSPSWWLGQVLMTVGEMGNFLAYGFAPASIVSPLGVVALISNCVIAPIFFGEHFRKRDFWGVVIAVLGAVTVVLSAKTEETKLEPHDVWDAITTMEFEIYMGVTISFIVVLMWASPRYGNRTILIDLGLVGLFGGYTALTTKGVSSMLSSTLWRAFTTPVTYGLLVVLLGTAVMQVRYVNKALQRFDSTQVIPVQFVTFTLSVIIGSAVLYRDFENATTQQAIKFAGGCALTFFGVFLITSGRHSHDEDEEHLSDDEDVEETIGLRRQRSSGSFDESRQRNAKPPQHTPSNRSSRRPSLSSRGVSFADDVAQPANHGGGVMIASARSSESPATRPLLPPLDEPSPVFDSPWQSSSQGHPSSRPNYPSVFVSNDSIATYESGPSIAAQSEALQSTKSLPPPSADSPLQERPTTPPQRHSISLSRPVGSHYSNKFISPSPLSSTVTAVVGDSLRGEPTGLSPRKSNRRLRPSIRNSLFVPYDEDDDLGSPTANSHSRSVTDNEPLMNGQGVDNPDQDSPSTRRRANSLGATLETIFGRKKKTRSSTIDTVTGETRQSRESSSGPGAGSSGGSEQ
ncbi:magnesium transporter NIPA-domain-containing protein [Microdochium trichocladiopsis]|uniref:Magnesium transporter NIPA-domain-containing protein n=1 Tax=Microdochium trichocladiopsis TaxID=1682393 RepID=A0A9P9BSE0_9PEZI|nr:magnesium transporter NIPA-domain-containing protein [Microdochium trichocladiopsis]KAH7037810.1 magnesium transporter NIPA-domain-containing protein [Microdochium trichocladiopsis]